MITASNELKTQVQGTIKRDPEFEDIIHTLQGLPVEKPVPTSLLQHYHLDEDGTLLYDQSHMCIPKGELRTQILHDHHDAPIAGHQGIERTYATMH